MATPQDRRAKEYADTLNTTRMKTWVHGYCPPWPRDKPVPFPSLNPTESHWIEEFASLFDKFYSTPDLPYKSDIVIIGAGLTGVSAAYHLVLANPSLKILLLDARGFSCGATGRNGGHVFRPEGYDMRASAEFLGVKKAVDMRRFHIANRDALSNVVSEYRLEEKVDWTFKGGVQIFGSVGERDDFLADLKFCEEVGFETRNVVLSREEVAEVRS
jgi:hypothetical protein